MNFLAHLYLSGDNPKIMVGNFIGDFVKGRAQLEKFEPEIIRGVELHRAIDLFTDTNAIVKQSKDRLRTTYRHYAGVIVDVFYDYYLARYWDSYHTQPLHDFASRAYTTINQFHDVLPDAVKQLLPYMMRGNWLVNYARIEGIQRTLTGMSRRTSFVSHMDQAAAELLKYEDAFRKEFEAFFPELTAHAAQYRQKV